MLDADGDDDLDRLRAAGLEVRVVTVDDAVLWSKAPFIRGTVSKRAETSPVCTKVVAPPRRSTGSMVPSRRPRGGLTLDALVLDSIARRHDGVERSMRLNLQAQQHPEQGSARGL